MDCVTISYKYFIDNKEIKILTFTNDFLQTQNYEIYKRSNMSLIDTNHSFMKMIQSDSSLFYCKDSIIYHFDGSTICERIRYQNKSITINQHFNYYIGDIKCYIDDFTIENNTLKIRTTKKIIYVDGDTIEELNINKDTFAKKINDQLIIPSTHLYSGTIINLFIFDNNSIVITYSIIDNIITLFFYKNDSKCFELECSELALHHDIILDNDVFIVTDGSQKKLLKFI